MIMSFKYEIDNNKAFLLSLDSRKYLNTDLPKLFHGDILDEDYKILSSEVRNNYLVGTFSTSQTQRFGKNKKGNIIYLIKPINSKIPGFMVSYGGKLTGKLAIRFKFTEWKNKLPSGEIIDIIGNYTEENLINILMYHHNVYPKKIKYEGNNIDNNLVRKELDFNVFSIDPDSCEDIDDALSIIIKDKTIVIGVHIAQPSSFLSLNDIKNKMKYQFSTLYINEERKDLWGEEITNKSSLFEGEKKPAYTTLFHFQDYKLVQIEDFPSLVTNNKKLTYDNAKNYGPAEDLKKFTQKISTEIFDYHDMVSFWMVKTNHHIGNKLKDLIPFRVNSEKKEINVKSFENLPKDICKKILSKKIDAASYSFDKTRHETLGLDNYCHFTSPIRRIIDTWIHYILTYSIHDDVIDIDILNKFDKETKKFHRQIELNNIISTVFKETGKVEKIGFITEILSDNLIEVYLHEFGFLKIKLYNIIFDYLVKKERTDNYIKLKYASQEYCYKIGDKLNITLNKIEGTLPKDKMLVFHKEGLTFI